MKVLSAESNIGTATTVSSATAVRLYNSDSSVGIVTRTDDSNSTIGNFTVPAGQVLYLQKKSTDKLLASSTVLASKVAYSHMMSYASYTSSGGGGGIPFRTSNLELYIDPASYTSGTTVADSSGNSRTYNLVNGVAHNTSPSRFTFDGTDDFLEAASDYSITTTNSTFVVWIKRDGSQDGHAGIILDRSGGVGGLNFVSGSTFLGYNSNGYNTGLSISNATWTMCAVSINSTTAKIYRFTSSSTPSTNTRTTTHSSTTFTNIKIGRDPFGDGARSFTGDIGHSLFYSATLSDSDIIDIYDNTKSTYGY